jgi:hypothetical protein
MDRKNLYSAVPFYLIDTVLHLDFIRESSVDETTKNDTHENTIENL